PKLQPAEGVSIAPKITVEHARVDWSLPAFVVDRRIRACTPNPGAWSTFRGERLKLGPVRPVAGAAAPGAAAPDVAGPGAAAPGAAGPGAAAPGDVAPVAPGELLVQYHRVLVGTGAGAVELGEVQAPGKRRIAAVDWARGVRPEAGERLG